MTFQSLQDLIQAGLDRNNIESKQLLARMAGVNVTDNESLVCALNVLDYGRYLREARTAVEEAMTALKTMIQAGGEAGLKKSFMAQAGGVTRQTVYDALDKKDDD